MSERSVCIVTGGASGLGAAITERLRSNDWRVLVADVKDAGDDSVVCDVTDDGAVAAMVKAAAGMGDVRGMVLSAAVETRSAVTDCTDDEWQRIIDVNLKGPF